jgi:octaprenyl-diphosphate synthase
MVFARLKPHMAELDRFLREQIAVFEPEIRTMADYCIDTSGKRIRPALVFLSGWRPSGSPSPDLVKAAAVVELVHLATLVHDDIMDQADLRRNRRTAAREYGATAAVLLGDALFSHALHLAAQFPTTEVCLMVSESTRRVCAGEIVQTMRRGSTNITREDYWRIIDLKTAELFRASCHLGPVWPVSARPTFLRWPTLAGTSALRIRSTMTSPIFTGMSNRSARPWAPIWRAERSPCRCRS